MIPVNVCCVNTGRDFLAYVQDRAVAGRQWFGAFGSHEEAVLDLKRRGLLTAENELALRQNVPVPGAGVYVDAVLWNKRALDGMLHVAGNGWLQ